MCQNKELLTLVSAACITEPEPSAPAPERRNVNINQGAASLIVQPRKARIHDPHCAVLLCNRLREHERVKNETYCWIKHRRRRASDSDKDIR